MADISAINGDTMKHPELVNNHQFQVLSITNVRILFQMVFKNNWCMHITCMTNQLLAPKELIFLSFHFSSVLFFELLAHLWTLQRHFLINERSHLEQSDEIMGSLCNYLGVQRGKPQLLLTDMPGQQYSLHEGSFTKESVRGVVEKFKNGTLEYQSK